MENAEKIGLGVAATGHVLLFGLLSLSLLSKPDASFKPKPIEVMIADEVGLESAAPDPAKLPPATSVAPEIGLPQESEIVAAPPKAEPLPKPPKVEPTPTPSPKPAPASKPTPQPKPKPKPTPKPAASKPSTQPSKPTTTPAKAKPADKPKPRGSRLGADFLKGVTDSPSVSRSQNVAAEKASPQAVASLQRELYRLVKQHWKPPTGADAELLRTTVTARLDTNGNIVGTPTAKTTGITASNRSQVKIHQERAIAAVKLAAPFKSFPEKFYDEWKLIEPILYLGV